MARSRNIKPGLYKNEDLAECSIWARFIFPGLWMLADREGRLEDRPKRIKGELLPYDGPDMDKLLVELHNHGFIYRYRNEDGEFIQILNFDRHQSPHYSEKPSTIKPPTFSEHSEKMERIKKPDSEKTPPIKRGSQPPDSLIPDSPNPDSLIPDSEPPPQEGRGEARASRLPAHWALSDPLREWTREQRPEWSDDRGRLEVMQFIDHYTGTGEKRADWDATWRKWIRGGLERDRKAPRASPRTDPAAMDLLLGNADAAH